MTQPNILQILKQRGFIQQTTGEDAIEARFASAPQRIYTGYDPTADSLHVGHLVPLMALKHLERAGHRPIVILGGGTAQVGDPTGKSEMRPMLARAQLEANVQAIGAQISRLLTVDAAHTTVINNAEWLQSLHYIDFLRDVGRHFSVNRMLSMETYKRRLEHGLSFIEFNYQLLQAYDFWKLNQDYDCHFQFGGDDQWGNIVAGVDLCRRMGNQTVHGMTCPLLTTASGAKMGKTVAGAIWLDPRKLAPYDYYQYWINTEDADVTRFLALFTLLPMSQIEQTRNLQGALINQAKAILAYEATALVHGPAQATQAHTAAQSAFGARALDPELLKDSQVPRTVNLQQQAIPTHTVTQAELTEGLFWTTLLVSLGAARSKGEARRLIEQGGLKANDAIIQDGFAQILAQDFVNDQILLRAGKKRVFRVILS